MNSLNQVMSYRFDAHVLAVIDMWGSSGARWRRWVIVAEFLAGVALPLWLGGLLLRADGFVPTVLTVCFWGVAANYAVLSSHAISLLRPGQLEAAIDGIDVAGTLRYYMTAQLRVVVPFLLPFLEMRRLSRLQRIRRRRRRRTGLRSGR